MRLCLTAVLLAAAGHLLADDAWRPPSRTHVAPHTKLN
jgi:hypothetical protein